jgi:hypothetical protein
MNDIDTTQLARWLAATDIDELELRSPTGHVRLRRGAGAAGAEFLGGAESPAAAGTAVATAAARGTAAATASSVGIFLDRHPLRDAPFVQAGDAVTGSAVGYGTAVLAIASPGDPA